MNASFGIDHPLIAVHDIEKMRNTMISLGFNMTAIGKHPWGTSTSLAMFEGCLIEIMGIYDNSLLDEVPAGDFRFGRHIYTHLQDREGIALTALHSTDSVADAKQATQAGFTVSGHLEFGRDVILPDGQTGRTKTTLALMPNTRWPRLSFFLCQQHRPELIYAPEWLLHPNTVFGMCGITLLANLTEHAALQHLFEGIYGPACAIKGGFAVITANGPMRVQDRAAIETEFGPLPEAISSQAAPGIVAVDLYYKNINTLRHWIKNSGLQYFEAKGNITLKHSTKTGNTFLRFCKI